MNPLVNWIIVTLSVLVSAYVLPGVTVSGFLAALLVALLLGIMNAFIKPFLLFLTLPINLLSLGLFTLVINAVIILLVSAIAPGFSVDGFGWALLFSLILSIIVDILYFVF